MSKRFSIRVLDDNGNPREGVGVVVDFGHLIGHAQEYTDEGGWAEFEVSDSISTSSGEIYVNHESEGEYGLNDGDSFSFTL